MESNRELDAYFRLMEEQPSLFENDGACLTIEKNRSKIEEYISKTGKCLGVVYESPWHLLVVDLVVSDDGRTFTYERIISPRRGMPVVCVVHYHDKLILLVQYRHAIRGLQYAFPRGFGEDGLTPCENAKKEIEEEVGILPEQTEVLGEFVSDSGLSGERIAVVHCIVSEIRPKKGYEEIQNFLLVTEDECREMIKSGIIDDGLSIVAFTLYLEKKIKGVRFEGGF